MNMTDDVSRSLKSAKVGVMELYFRGVGVSWWVGVYGERDGRVGNKYFYTHRSF